MNIEQAIAALNPRQREAVLHADGPLLILAGAGSGKTRVITVRTAWLIHSGVPASGILAVTFTNKAAREMKERASAIVKGAGRKGPLVSTFHSLCANILRREIERIGYHKDFTIYDTSDQLAVMRGILADVKFHDKSFKTEQVLERINRSRSGMSARIPAAAKHAAAEDDLDSVSEALYPKYREVLKSLNALDFDDLIVLTLQLFNEHPDVLDRYRERFRYIMVDEYQDTNRMQYDLIRLMAGERKNLCVVGDDDQSIYAWRGASLSNILDFERDYPGAKVVRLEQNYRSVGNILKAANGVIRNNRRRMEKALWTERSDGPEVKIYRAPDGDREAEWVADRVLRLSYEKKLSFEEMAVIYRANAFSRQFEAALRRQRTPYSVVGGMSYFEYREVKDLASYLRIIANPRDDVSLLRIANTPKRGLGPTTIGGIAEFARNRTITLLDALRTARDVPGLGEKAGESAAGLVALLERYKSLFGRGSNMAAVLSGLVDEIHYYDHIYSLYKTPEAAMQRVENIKGFIESLGHYEKNEESPSLQGFLETMALAEDLKEKEDKNARGVTLISFHSAKGLEFPVVFISGAEEDVLPHKKSSTDEGGIEEERRLFYVGITRAMRELYITYAANRVRYGKNMPCSPSRFIEELPEDAVKRISGADDGDDVDDETAARAFFSNIKAILGD